LGRDEAMVYLGYLCKLVIQYMRDHGLAQAKRLSVYENREFELSGI
jgi:hypothetical protein